MTSLRTFGAKLARTAWVVFVLCTGTALTSPAQTFTTLVSFDFNDGTIPAYESLVQGADGNLYGTTAYGGHNNFPCGGTLGCGTIFRITPAGVLTTLYNFCLLLNCEDGDLPSGGLIQATDGNFYGTTFGTVFKITPAGTLTTLYNFCSQPECTDGSGANGLVQATDGNFYGTTYSGGANCLDSGPPGCGTVFEVSPAGKLTTLYSFCPDFSICSDGMLPLGRLVQGSDGNFYGTTSEEDFNFIGTVFKITPTGTLTALYTFCSQPDCTDGDFPFAGLVQASDGNLYGTTTSGGAHCIKYGGCGTVFKITPGGKLTTLYSFCSRTKCSDGQVPIAGLVQATDGNFYGTTYSGGANNRGTVFEITPAGKLTTLYSFCSQPGCTDGGFPSAGLVQATDGNFYGTTSKGGADLGRCVNPNPGCGTVFRLSVGLGPFVETRPTSGRVGAAPKILGTNLKGATSVSFNGTAATFTVVSATEIKTTVPAGSTTGTVTVTTPHGTFNSNVKFRVAP
jgi:uncharacterized repeat protein (TIGR03803 family)